MKKTLYIILMLSGILFLGGPVFSQGYQFERLWPVLEQPWYFQYPRGVSVDISGNVYVADSSTTPPDTKVLSSYTTNNRCTKFTRQERI